MDERRLTLYERLRRSASPSSVPGALPVLFFGDLFSAEVVTVALNPSDQEYLDRSGAILAGSKQRFATLETVGAVDRSALTDDQCEEAIRWMRAYFGAGKPIYGWFRGLGRVVDGFGFSFQAGSAAHLDLVQEATKPTWSDLPPAERDALLATDLPFLEWQIRTFPLRAVLCNGATPGRYVRQRFGVELIDEGRVALIKWWVGRAEVAGREVTFAGWNYPLRQPTGLTREGEHELGELLATRLDLDHLKGLTARTAGMGTPVGTNTVQLADTLVKPEAPTIETPSLESTGGVSTRAGSRLTGLTDPVWNGVTLPTLRSWLSWWQDERRSAGRVENGWGREEQVVRISAEIAAREAAGLGKASRSRGCSPSSSSTGRGSRIPSTPPTKPASRPVSPARPLATSVDRDELLALVDERAGAVRGYLEWARDNDNDDWSFRMAERPDIARAAATCELFPEEWWAVVVYSCFDSTTGAATVAPHFQEPLPPDHAEALLAELAFPRGSVGGHRIQPAVKGARQALVSACANHGLFQDVLHGEEGFDARYRRIRGASMRQWGRTTSFDLLLRAGFLGVGGRHYQPEYAYLSGSTGPKAGFAKVFGRTITDDADVAWAESVLRAWTNEWAAVADHAGVTWDRLPLQPCDQENFLCIYQERRR